jgi:hypothetical protein
MIPLEIIGAVLATVGSITSVIGSLYNNLKHDHLTAMKIWGYGSNPLLLIWSIGLCFKIWDGGISGAALVLMYGIFTVTNLWGLKE